MVLDYSSTSFGDIPIKHSSELDGSPCRVRGTSTEQPAEEEERPQHTLVQPTVERRSVNQHRSKIPQPARQAFPTQQPSSQDPKQEHRESLL